MTQIKNNIAAMLKRAIQAISRYVVLLILPKLYIIFGYYAQIALESSTPTMPNHHYPEVNIRGIFKIEKIR
jgi:hypothetical protein